MNITHLPKSSKIAILGFGKEGRSSMSFLIRLGFSDITILDQNTDIETAALPENVSHILGVEYLDTLADFDVIIKAPGVSPYLPALAPYKDKFLSQTQIFFEFYTGKVIGITGTKGKSTVSSLVYKTLKHAGYNVKLVGNIGTPVLEEIDVLAEKSYDYIVYELSSYMLEGFAPELYIGYINNIHPCHLDWHTNIDIYTQAKYNILTNAQHTITHTDIKGGAYTFPDKKGFSYKNGAFYYQETPLFKDSEIQLLGEHNRINICGVLTLLHCIIPNVETLSETLYGVLKTFHPLPHRLENIGIYNDITFIDDGIAVTPDATIAAICSISNLQTLLTGGKDIGMYQQKLEAEIQASSINTLVLFPDTGYLLFPEYTTKQDEEVPFEFTLDGRSVHVLKTRSMESAVQFALENTEQHNAVLLSSAAQSYSLWKNFEEKGQQYKHYIEKHAKI